MAERLALHPADWVILGLYLLFALGVGWFVKEKSEAGSESYFLAGRSLPWWWAGMSIAATTFAADTPLAVTGIVASRGISGNWIWLSWLGVHAAVVVYFARTWRRSEMITDAELVELRYSGRPARWLRLTRVGLYAVVYNCIILGWVLRAMVKIVTPFFHWDAWLPSLVGLLARFWPASSPLGTPSEGLTIMALLGIVALYSTLGGIRGVIFTDLVQLSIALIGSFWFAFSAWDAVGGRAGLLEGLTRLYGVDHGYLALFPSSDSGWLAAAGIGAFAFGVYLIVQSYANVPADGGGYLMQRLNTTIDDDHARRASLLFLLLQYVLRAGPWLVVGLVALVLIPLGQEASALGGAAAVVGDDRELAYPVLMLDLLPPIVLGFMVTSLLAAFMSTVDTHINWGASYIVTDLYLPFRPESSPAEQVRLARFAVAGFALAAVLVSFQIDTIEQAWKWVAALGAALGIPTALRWLWWRVNASGELGAMIAGLGIAAVLMLATEVSYELRLILISAASVVGLAFGMLFGPPTDSEVLERFVERVEPLGVWPERRSVRGAHELIRTVLRWLAVSLGTVALIGALHYTVLLGRYGVGALLGILGGLAVALGAAAPPSPARHEMGPPSNQVAAG